MDWWSVYVETRGDDATLVSDDALGELVNALAPHSGIAAGGGGHASWGATVSVQAATAAEAVSEAAAVITRIGTTAGLPPWPVVRGEAVREDVLDEDLRSPR